MAYLDPQKETRLYVDEGPAGVAATVAQIQEIQGVDHSVWRPVNHTSRSKTVSELNYGKVDGESLGILTGIKSNKMYLHGAPFTVVVDHEPLVNMYNSHSKEVTVRVARHKSKLLAYDFTVTYQPGVVNPCDYGSRNPPPAQAYTEEEKEELGVEEEDEERDILVCRQVELADAVTLPVLQRYTDEDSLLKGLKEDIKKGALNTDRTKTDFAQCFNELSVHEEIIMRGERIIVPKKLRGDVIKAAHVGHPGKDRMLKQLRASTWWPGMTKDVKEYEMSCIGCSASRAVNSTPPMTIREIPERPWQHLSADYKGPIGGQYHLHVLIDNYTR